MPDVFLISEAPPNVFLITEPGQGPQGPPGTAGGGVYTEGFSATGGVTVIHNLGRQPAVTVVDTGGNELEVDVLHTSAIQCVLAWAGALSGTVYCN